jgi:hypothetical protein
VAVVAEPGTAQSVVTAEKVAVVVVQVVHRELVAETH